ncbi:MAG: hypothetical protein KAV25_06775 [Methanophagales archaeon]|nr:hypothetical protein [Methanophagales archaeon]
MMKRMKKESGKGEARKKSKKLPTVVLTAMLVSLVMAAFISVAAANVTSFTITPDTGWAGAVDAYSAVVNTTGFISLTITIPAGFGAVTPTTGGEEIARIDLWNSSGYYGYAIFTANNANPSTKVDVYTNIGGDIATTTQNIDYSPGGITSIMSPFGGPSEATLTLPTPSVNGSLFITLPASIELTNVSISIGKFVQNPAVAANYVFTADGVPGKVQLTGVSAEEYQQMITEPIDVSKIRYKFTFVDEEWAAKWTNEILYGQKETKYSIAVYLNKTGYVTGVDLERWGFPITTIPYELAEQSLKKLPPGYNIDP